MLRCLLDIDMEDLTIHSTVVKAWLHASAALTDGKQTAASNQLIQDDLAV